MADPAWSTRFSDPAVYKEATVAMLRSIIFTFAVCGQSDGCTVDSTRSDYSSNPGVKESDLVLTRAAFRFDRRVIG
jgi:hypothetical protein